MSRSNQPSYPFLKGDSKKGPQLQGRDAPTPRQLYAYYAKAGFVGPCGLVDAIDGIFSDGDLEACQNPGN